jgi:peptidase E
MIKFVLHGGDTSENNNDNNSFFREMTVSRKKNINILLNYFSRKAEDVERCFNQDTKRFKKVSFVKDLEFKIADPKKLAEQLNWADVMYMRGGWTELLIKKLAKTKDLEKLMEGKVIGGSSAGVYCLAKYYYGNDSKKIGKGLGILKLKTYCHYENKDAKIVEQLTSYKEDLPLLALPNYKWVVMYK